MAAHRVWRGVQHSPRPGREPFSCQLITNTQAAHGTGQNNSVIFPLSASALTKLATVQSPGVLGSLSLFPIPLSPQPGPHALLLAPCGVLPRDRCSQLPWEGQRKPHCPPRGSQGSLQIFYLSIHKTGLFQGLGGVSHIRQLGCFPGLKDAPSPAPAVKWGRNRAHGGRTSAFFC